MARYRGERRGGGQVSALIAAKQYVLDSDWGEVQPGAEAQNAYLDRHAWDDTRPGTWG